MGNIYRHRYVRVDYPLERGYRMEPKALPNWMHLTVERDGDSKYLVVNSRIHMNKSVRINPSYSAEWSDLDIIKDLSGEIWYRFIK